VNLLAANFAGILWNERRPHPFHKSAPVLIKHWVSVKNGVAFSTALDDGPFNHTE
jgi:hypothetical protein